MCSRTTSLTERGKRRSERRKNSSFPVFRWKREPKELCRRWCLLIFLAFSLAFFMISSSCFPLSFSLSLFVSSFLSMAWVIFFFFSVRMSCHLYLSFLIFCASGKGSRDPFLAVIIITHTASYFLEWNSSISFSKHRRDLGNERHVFLSILTLSHLLHHFDHIFSSLGWSSLSFFSSLMRYTFFLSLLIPCVFRIEEMQTLLLLLLLLLCWNLCPSFTLIRGWKT